MDLPQITERPEEENRKRPASLLAHGFRPLRTPGGAWHQRAAPIKWPETFPETSE